MKDARQADDIFREYAVAYTNLFDNDLEIISVEASSMVAAIIKGVRELIDPPKEEDEWLAGLLDKTVEEIQEEFFNVDRLVAVMPLQ
jgi:hypothetical protein